MPDFVHAHASHCESGVMSSLLRHCGMPMSEAMAFGLSSALAFAYLPCIRATTSSLTCCGAGSYRSKCIE